MRPRVVQLSPAFDVGCIFAAPSSRLIVAKIKANLSKLCDVTEAPELLKWVDKFTVEIMDLCRIEVVQLQGMAVKS